MRRIFCTDLDSTIICSQVPSEFGICVAVKNGKNASFMRNESYDKFLRIINKIKTIPITTRCEKSYENIYLKKYFDYALVDNGAILVCQDPLVKEEWFNESMEISKPDRNNFDKIRKIIENYGYYEKWGSEFVLDYVNKDATPELQEKIRKEIEPFSSNFLINIGKTSFLCTFNSLSKGENIKRFAKKFGYELYISAGDNKEDESMFKVTSISIGKKNATFNFDIKDKLDYCDKVIDKVCEIIK